MNTTIEIRNDKKRGCGYRKPGGLYFVSDGPGAPCGRLPAPLDRCPTCDHGIKPTRGTTWVDAGELLSKRSCKSAATECASCPTITGRHLLVWIGEQFYPTPEAWLRESFSQGVSRRIGALPRDFVLGETWGLVAHRRALPVTPCGEAFNLVGATCARAVGHPGEHHDEAEYRAGIFHAFKPSAVEYVVKGDETEDELESLRKRGITPVKVFVAGLPVEQLHDGGDDDDTCE